MSAPRPLPTPLDLDATRPYPIEARRNKAEAGSFGRLVGPDDSVAAFLASLPGFLGASALNDLAHEIAAAHRRGRPVVLAMGAHVVKVGCAPIVIDLVERGIVTALVVNGAFVIHDYEVALIGATSEHVDVTIKDGSFGWAREPADAFARACRRGADEGIGLGRAMALEAEAAIARRGGAAGPSVLAACARLGVPLCVHVAIGTDTTHMHAALDPSTLGSASHLDFRIAARIVTELDGGVWLNVGSAVVLPEVFLKLVSIARNLGFPLESVVAGNMDMLQHYRTQANVIGRPVRRGIAITGHHEVNLPLLRVAILAALAREAAARDRAGT